MGHTEKKSVYFLKLINPMEIEAIAIKFLKVLLNMTDSQRLENISL